MTLFCRPLADFSQEVPVLLAEGTIFQQKSNLCTNPGTYGIFFCRIVVQFEAISRMICRIKTLFSFRQYDGTIKTLNIYISAYQAIIRSYM